MPRDATRSASSEANAWSVPAELRDQLAQRYGPVLNGTEAEHAVQGLGEFATCGDRVTADAIRWGHAPRLGIVDYVTLRHEPIDRGVFRPLADRREVRVVNPAGTLTDRLYHAVKETWDAGGGLIEVVGEEDLGSLALVAQLPLGTTVIYGIPSEGASFVKVDRAAKDRVQQLLARMERRRIDLGD